MVEAVLVSRKFYELDGITRKHVTVYLHYAPSPFRFNQRFPFIESLTLKEFPAYDYEFGNDAISWIREIAVSFKCLKALHIRRLFIDDSDLELLAKTRGIETFSLKLHKDSSYYRDIAPLLKNSCKSLVSLRIKEYSIDEIGDALSYAVNLAHLSVAFLKLNVDSGNWRSTGYMLKILYYVPFFKGVPTWKLSESRKFGLIAVAQGCANLELLHVILTDISNEALECIGSNLKSLCDFDIQVGRGGYNIRTSLPLDNGIRAMLIGCTKLERLGESDAGLVELSKGCPKLRKLRMVDCPFSKQTVTVPGHLPEYFSATRPNSKASTITSEVPYIILVERLCELAVQLVAGGSAVKYVKVTLASAREPNDLDTQSSEKPLESIQVQIAEVESRFVSAISVSGDINVEGKLKDGVPHLTKVGDFEVVVSLIEYRYIILSGQVDQTGIIGSIRSILLKEDHVSVCLTSVGRTSIGQQAVMAFLVNWEPKEKALKSIGKISAVKEVVLLTLFL
ncbi:leucine-rich repeat, cysteine-containing subtype protein [Tanacetum coccineum]